MNALLKSDIVINAVGCPKSGGALVFQHVARLLSKFHKTFSWTSGTAVSSNEDLHAQGYLPAKFANRALRVLWEFCLGVAISKVSRCVLINLSNYGFSVGGCSVLLIHSPEILQLGFPSKGIPNRLKDLFLRWSLFESDFVLVQTKHMEASLCDYVSRNCLRKPPVMIFMSGFEKRLFVSGRDLAEKPLRFFYPASDFPHKRIDLCESLASNFSNKDFDLFVTNSTVQSLNFHGMGVLAHSEVIHFFEMSDALLFTSEMETLGLPLLEALGFSLPAVLPNLPYAKEIYGDAAVYFDKFDASSVRDAIQELSENFCLYRSKASSRADVLARRCLESDSNLLALVEFNGGFVL